MNKTCENIMRIGNLSMNVMLFASIGIGKHWNYTGKMFKSLLYDNPSIGEINLTTIVFSAYDLNWLMPKQERFLPYNDRSTNYGISKFVKTWKEANMSRIGFVIDISTIVDDGNGQFHVDRIEKQSRILCGPIFEQADISVWEYMVNYNLTSASNFTYDLDESNLKGVLIKMLIAREMFLKRYPQKEVVFSINTDNLVKNSVEDLKSCNLNAWKEDGKMKLLILGWARINGVKIMFRPAFDLKYPLYGYGYPPKENGEYDMPVFSNCDK